MSATVRINPQSHRKLKSLAAEMGESMPIVLEHAIEALRRHSGNPTAAKIASLCLIRRLLQFVVSLNVFVEERVRRIEGDDE